MAQARFSNTPSPRGESFHLIHDRQDSRHTTHDSLVERPTDRAHTRQPRTAKESGNESRGRGMHRDRGKRPSRLPRTNVTRRDARDCRVCYGPDCYVMQCDVYWMECVLRSGPSRLRLRTYPRRLWSVLEVASPPHGTLVRS